MLFKTLKKFIIFTPLLFSTSVYSQPNTPPPYTDMVGKRLSSIECLAVNLYHESRSESDIANIYINAVVFNRVADKRYPDTICGVVFQRKQFSWVNDGKSDKIKDLFQYKRLYKLAEESILNREFIMKFSEGVTHYHTKSINPYWSTSRGMNYVDVVGEHKFYRWK